MDRDQIDIAAIRKALGDTQEAFGARFGVDQGTVSRWENFGVPRTGTTRVAIEAVLAAINREDDPA